MYGIYLSTPSASLHHQPVNAIPRSNHPWISVFGSDSDSDLLDPCGIPCAAQPRSLPVCVVDIARKRLRQHQEVCRVALDCAEDL